MSWGAHRYQKCEIVRARKERRQSATHRTDNQQLINRFVETDALASIFGSPSPEYALHVLVRVKGAKRRIPEVVLEQPAHTPCRPRRFPQRNFHHLTPQCRKDEPYYGDEWRNLLLMKVSRHNALHNECGVRTLEEIIRILLQCIRAGARQNLILKLATVFAAADYHARTQKWQRGRARRRSFRDREFDPDSAL